MEDNTHYVERYQIKLKYNELIRRISQMTFNKKNMIKIERN